MDSPETRPHVDMGELEQMIRERAFELYIERCMSQEDGSPESDWMVAAREIDRFVDIDAP